MRSILGLSFTLALSCLPHALAAPDRADPAEVRALFEKRCQMCHGSSQQMNGLRLDRRGAILKGGYSGPVIVPGDSSASHLIERVTSEKESFRMPPAGEPLGQEEIALLRSWIDQGAEWPEPPAEQPAPEPAVSENLEHWAFQPIRTPRPPAVHNEAWVRNPVDRFVLARLESKAIAPSPEAPKATLLRRVYFDLTGLPPTPAEVDRFLADNRPDAYERVVDELLRSPHYGERWAAPWLDAVRYADSDGYEKDWERPHAWRYREWVINALNENMPFDRFTIEQLAGDLLPGAAAEQQAATGFYRNTLKNREGGVDLEQFRFEETIDRANTIGQVWLGLTVGCAQCHDHKYDPISQKEYYQLFAFVNSLEEVNIPAPMPGEMGPYLAALPEYRAKRRKLLEEGGVFELQPAWEKNMILAAENPGQRTDWDHAYDAFQKTLDGGDRIIRKPPEQRTEREQERLTDHFVKNYHRVISKERWKELDWTTLRKKLIRLREEFPDLSRAMAVEQRAKSRMTHVHLRGAWDAKGIEVEPGTPAVLPALSAEEREEKPLRLALAEWLVSADNPLTARVTVNRIWQEYFGKGLVTTCGDFGTRSEPPSHPQLLDWLAASFGDGWDLKRLHKTIVMSAAYRQSSEARPELASVDPENRLLARQQRLRLPAELIRDNALKVSGLLYPKIGGRSVKPPQPEGVASLAYAGSVEWNESTGRDRYRRGLYIHFQRTVPYPQLVNFDIAGRNVAECSRERTNTPLQALNLLNDPVFMEAARALAVQVLEEKPSSSLDERLEYAFRRCLAREPAPHELEHLRDYYRRQVRILEAEQNSAEELMPVALPEANSIEAAAWTGVASVLLNLDEFITRE